MAAGRIIFWRHGQTDYNQERRVQGALDIELNESGIVQAERIAPYVAAMNPTRIISSPLKRAVRTAETVAGLKGLPVELDERLRERNFGDFEGLTREELSERFPEEYALWKSGGTPTQRGVETRGAVGERTSQAIIEACEQMDGGVLLVVAHGAALSCAMTAMLGLDSDVWSGVAGLDNCHWSLMRSFEQPPFWRLLAHNRVIPTECENELGVQGISSMEA
ncbi:MAG: histidine phosphatase family protein [Actinomycetaceae bacterium]|nr:histidine phosphatase family protein [Actinomycetaceae bacterium]